MEETLGKRIAYHRKRIGLTQDALAEQLGITAQAVSKWENDLSCPDIATLPRLADIFGITTDTLLGRETPQVHEAEVVENIASDEAEDPEDPEDRAMLRWQRRKWDGIGFAILVLWVGVWMLINRALGWEISFWNILWPSGLLWIGIRGLCKRFGAFNLGCTLFGAYFLLDQMPFWTFEITDELAFPILVVLLGMGLLIDAIFKPKKSKKKVKKKAKPVFVNNTDREPQIFYTVDGETFDCSVAFGSDSRTVTLNRLKNGDVNCVFGDLKLDLSGCAEVAEDAFIEINCSHGNVVLRVPERYRLEPEVNQVFNNYIVEGCPAPDAQPIQLEANVTFGQLIIHYISQNE